MEDKRQLDQLWYTWSTSGLGAMPMGFRVRAASTRFHDIQGMDYRRVDRFVRYEPPKGIRPIEINQRNAPVTLAYVSNGAEYLLVRKVFIGQGVHQRNGVFFTHLIAGLPSPPDFTARDAIRLWYCPELWVESEQGKAANDTRLNTISFGEIKRYVQQSQTNFNMAPISHELINLLQLILGEGLPSKISVRGRSTLCAALIYGITHCLPMSLLTDLTFTTYESEIDDFEARLLGTISADDLDSERTLVVNPAAPTVPVSSDIQSYVQTVVSCLLDHNVSKLSRLLAEAERNGYQSADQLIVLYKHRFRVGPLTLQQLEEIIRHPENNLDDLGDAALQQESAELLLKEVNYWSQRGKAFTDAVNSLTLGGRVTHSQEAREALTTFFNGVAEHVLVAMEAEIITKTLPIHPAGVLETLTPPTMYGQIWQRMIRKFAQKQEVYAEAMTDALWPFREWLLRNAKLMQSPPTLDEMRPWLQVAAWDKLSKLFKLELPDAWEGEAIMRMLQRVQDELPKPALPMIQAREATFKDVLQLLLIQGYQHNRPEWTKIAVRFFGGLVEREYQDRLAGMNEQAELERVMLLGFFVFLLNVTPKDPIVIEQLFSNVRFQTPYQLTISEIEAVLSQCNEEVIRACGDAPSLAKYLREWLLILTPGKLADEQVRKLLLLLAGQPAFEGLVADWTIISGFQYLDGITRDSLEKIKKTLRHLLEARHPEQDEQQQGFQITAQDRQGIDQQQQRFIKEMVPYLVKQVKTEPDLENVLDILGKDLPVSRQELLHWMAAAAGSNYAQTLSRLIPYLLRGMYEYEQLAHDKLDIYLRTLFRGADIQILKVVDRATRANIWPEEVLTTWKEWRERENSKQSGIDAADRPGKSPFADLAHTKDQSAGTQSKPDDSVGQRAQQFIVQTPAVSRETRVLGIVPETPKIGRWEQQTTQKPRQTPRPWQTPLLVDRQNRQYVVRIPKLRTGITRDYYERVRAVILQELNYFYSKVYLERQDIWSRSEKFEAYTIQKLLQELRLANVGVKESKSLIYYLVDNVLISNEIDRVIKQDGSKAQLFSVEKRNKTLFEEIKGTISRMFQGKDEDIDEVLRMLFRRNYFLQHLENIQQSGNEYKGLLGRLPKFPGRNTKSPLEQWLESQRVEARVE